MARRYFEEEMRYLHEAGKRFAERHPEQARMLNIDSVTDRDPYVERLFEGFAFLTGRIHERLDDDVPEYGEQLLNLLEPAALRPIPSLVMMAFRSKNLKQPVTLPRGTTIRSAPVGEQRTVCHFRTTQQVDLQPLRLADVSLAWTPEGTTTARLTLRFPNPLPWKKLQMNTLRLHFHAESGLASLMHRYFTQHVARITVEPKQALALEDAGEVALTLPPEALAPGGFGIDERLLPQPSASFSGFSLLQEYLSFRRKFWCVDLHGLDRLDPEATLSEVTIAVHFDRSYPEAKRFATEHVRLHCAPAVNLFSHDADPIRVAHEVSAYAVEPRQGQELEVYDVQRVVGMDTRTGARHEYTPLYRLPGTANGEERRYATQRRSGPAGRPKVYLQLNTRGISNALAEETLSVDLRCTNGTLPRERLQEGMITELGPEAPGGVTAVNLTAPTLILRSPQERSGGLPWEFVGHRALNYRTVAQRATLVGLLAWYDWTDDRAQQRLRQGIRKVQWSPKERVHRGAILRGAEVTIELNETHLPNEGEAVLLGQVLSRFLSMYATLNSFVHLTLVLIPSGTTYTWTPPAGHRPML